MNTLNKKEDESLKSPFIEQPTFDYNKLREETTLPAVQKIYKIFAENASLLVYTQESTEESITEDLNKVSQEVIKVPDADMQYVITIIQDTISSIFSGIVKQKERLEKEFLARTIGARDPGNNKFSREYTSLADLFLALEKVRLEQDTEENQYFIVAKK